MPIPDELIPDDARVEMDAKMAAGYFTEGLVPTESELGQAQGPGPQRVTSPAGQPSDADAEAAEARYLATPRAIRERAEALYRLARRGALAHFAVDEAALPALAERVVAVTRAAYPDLRAIPDHTRFRHFGVGGVDRVAALDARLDARWRAPAEQRRGCARSSSSRSPACCSTPARASAGRIARPAGETYARSEGLAVASYHLFASGALSDDPARAPFRADAAALAGFGDDALARGISGGRRQSAGRRRRARGAPAPPGPGRRPPTGCIRRRAGAAA